MPARLAKTKKHRNVKARKHGKKTKAARENSGTTPSFPATGPIPALRFGQPVDAKSIVVPAELLSR